MPANRLINSLFFLLIVHFLLGFALSRLAPLVRPLLRELGYAYLILGERALYGLLLPGCAFLLLFFLPHAARRKEPLPDSGDREKKVSLGDRLKNLLGWGPDFKTGAVYGAGLGALMFGAVFLLNYSGAAPNNAPDPNGASGRIALRPEFMALFFLSTGLITPLLEEFYYRGILQGFLQTRGGSTIAAILAPALLFALAHSPRSALPLGIFGLLLGILYWRYRLGAPILAHTTYNSLILLHFYVFGTAKT